ncbi:hypothetical protein C8F01DRAFT_1000211, partial [Mycena amicta]
LLQRNLEVSRPDSYVNKAVADGAVSFSLDHFVTVRVARETYSIECTMPYNPHDRQHVLCSKLGKNDLSGKKVLRKIFSPILLKVCPVPPSGILLEALELRSTFRTRLCLK